MISIVTSVYRSEPFLREFHARSRAALEAVKTQSYEFVFVIDGPTDNSIPLLLELKKTDEHIRIIELSRNFGHHSAMMTGIRATKGDHVFVIDCDLEEAPELLETFYQEMMSTEADVIFGVQEQRKGRIVERLTGSLFYWLYNRLAEVPIEKNILMARLLTRDYVDSLKLYEERSLFLGGVFALVGYDQRPLTVKKGNRGETNYSIRKRFSLMIDALTASTHKLLVYVFYTGIIISLLSLGVSAYYFTGIIFGSEYLSGWPSLILSLWFLSGVIILCIGVVGMYISKMFVEIKQRPLAVIKREL